MQVVRVLVVAALASCAPTVEEEEDPPPPEKVFEPIEESFVVGGEREVTVFVPDDYDPQEPLPFLFLLHGYGVTGPQMDSLIGLRAFANANRIIYAAPSGLIDRDGNPFWNATEACCDFYGTDVDDSAYLRSVVEEAQEIANIDAARIFIIGHSNGGFMAHRLACDHADLFTGIVSVAGASTVGACEPSRGIAVLQIHGTNDTTILYDGGNVAPGVSYPGAQETAALWATRNECDPTPVDVGSIDLETIAGDETSIKRFEGCREEGAVELWTVAGGSHVPNGNLDYLSFLFAFLQDHAR
jgi:polyhydroxybutyrate depolymerase